MLTGEKPYHAESPLAVIYKHANAPIPRLPGDLAPLQGLLDGLLAKRREDRLPSAAAVVATIDQLLHLSRARERSVRSAG
ncbi:MAG TPA: hypothetical protein VNS57_01890, partial [Steroidobacteraceae bacterium]|nr:hypothetical protein [Steroidobacteraceae bacterium]